MFERAEPGPRRRLRLVRGVALAALGLAMVSPIGARPTPPRDPLTPARVGTATPKRPRRVLDQAILTLSPPQLAAPLLSEVRATIQPVARYRGTGTVTWELLSGPEGMTVDSGSGLLFWTPPAASEGTAPEVRMRATDGCATAETSFALPVAAPIPVTSTLAGSTLTATQGSLQGVSWTFPAQTSRPLAELAVATVPAGQAPPLPPGAVKVSDFFRVAPVSAADGSMITVALPKRLVPAGRASHELRLWVYTDRVDGAVEPGWVCTWRERDVLPGGTATIKLKDLGELSFVGVPSTPVAAPPAASAAIRVTSSPAIGDLRAVTTSCEQKLLADGTRDPSTQHCAIASEPPFVLWVKDFDRNGWNPDARVPDLAGWLVAARAKVAALGLASDPTLEVVVEDIANPTWLGFVTGAEDFRTIHLDEETKWTRDQMQCATAHEFFHHAQSRTVVAGLGNVLTAGGQQTQWLTEGTARWFEDEVFDSLDSFRTLNGTPLPRVLAPGLAATPAAHPATDPERYPYHRFAFFKMLASRCPGLNLPALLNADLATDPSAASRLRSLVQSWRCDFGEPFGTAGAMRTHLGTGLFLYTLATQIRNDLSVLEADETGYFFQRIAGLAIASTTCTGPGSCPSPGMASGTLPPLGADWVMISVPTTPPPAHEIVVEVTNGSFQTGYSWAWLGSRGLLSLAGFGRLLSPGTISWRPGADPPPADLTAVVVNPSTTTPAPWAVYAKLLDRSPTSQSFTIDTTYSERGLNLPEGVLVYHLTAQATVTGLAAMQLSDLGGADPEYPESRRATVRSNGLTPPYTVTLAGTLDVVPSPMVGSYRAPGAARTQHWQFGQKRYVNDCYVGTGIATTPGFSLEFTAQPGAERYSSHGPCVQYTWGTWETDDEGKIYNNWGYSYSSRGSLSLEVNPY